MTTTHDKDIDLESGSTCQSVIFGNLTLILGENRFRIDHVMLKFIAATEIRIKIIRRLELELRQS